MTTPAKKLFVKSYGCQMNVYDSERMTALLAAEGYEATPEPAAADLEVGLDREEAEVGRLGHRRDDRVGGDHELRALDRHR